MPITAAIRLRRVITNSAPPIVAAANAQNNSAIALPDSTVSLCGLRVAPQCSTGCAGLRCAFARCGADCAELGRARDGRRDARS